MPRRRSSAADEPKAAPAWWRLLSACGRAVRRVVQTLFVRQLRLRRVDGKLAVALEDNKPAGAEADASTAATARPADLTRGELTALLDAAPGSRSLLRTLAAVEHGLKHKDPTGLFLYEVDATRLRAALRQLDGLAPQQPSAGLLTLRGRIVDAIGVHEQQEKRLEMLMPRSDLMQGNRMEVGEARASDFDRANEQWQAKDAAK